MRKTRTGVRELYVHPTVEVIEVKPESEFFAGSPDVRPGGGGTPAQQGTVQVIEAKEEDGGDDDNLEGWELIFIWVKVKHFSTVLEVVGRIAFMQLTFTSYTSFRKFNIELQSQVLV